MSFAQMMAQQAGATTQSSTPDFGQAYVQGSQLALQKEQVQQQKQQAQQAAAQLQDAKAQKFMDQYGKAMQWKNPQARQNFIKQLPQFRDALGLGDIISDETLKGFAGNEEYMGKVATLQSMIESQELSYTDAIKMMNDPALMADIPVTPLNMITADPDLLATHQRVVERGAQLERAEVTASGVERRHSQTMEVRQEERFENMANQLRNVVRQDIQPISSGLGTLQSIKQDLTEMRARAARGESITREDMQKIRAQQRQISRAATSTEGRLFAADIEGIQSRYGLLGSVVDTAEWVIGRPISMDKIEEYSAFVDEYTAAMERALDDNLGMVEESAAASPALGRELERALQLAGVPATRRAQERRQRAASPEDQRTSPKESLQAPEAVQLSPDQAVELKTAAERSGNPTAFYTAVAEELGMSVEDLMKLVEQNNVGAQ